MPESRVTVINPLGLHARAAAQLVKLAGRFQSRITLSRPGVADTYADARSILSLLSLAASKGSELTVHVEGDDSGNALASVVALFENGFGEL